MASGDIPQGFGDVTNVALSGTGPARQVLTKPEDYKQFFTLTPVCRVHVYQKNQGKGWGEPGPLPSHWCGDNPGDNVNEVPDIIFGKEGVYLGDMTPMEFQILTARVNSTRQWQCSSAMFQIAAPLDASTAPTACPIRPNDVIVMEMGYCNGLDSQVSLPTGRTNYDAFVGDVVFYGIVDTIKERGGSGEKD